MKQLVIVGAGGFGREVLEWATACPSYRKEWEIAGFLDDRPDALQGFESIGLRVIGTTRDYIPTPKDVFIIAIGHPETRSSLRQRITSKGGEFTRVIHESCSIGRRVDLQPGVILCPRVTLTCDLSIGCNTAININSAVGHDAVIGDDCQLSSFCDVTGHVTIGDRVMMGSRASIIPGKRVGDGSTVGAGSVVVSDVPDSVTVFGNPATILTRNT